MSDVAERMAERAERAVTVMTDEDWTPDLTVHPAAAVFPMLADDELRDLADDIKANGLRFPIVLDPTGRILDGRNRYAACKLAGVEPSYITFGGDEGEIVSFILSMNERRRHSTEGQRAIATVRAILELHNLCNSDVNQSSLSASSGVAQQRISQALVIVEHAPELADAVMAKTAPFSKAYEAARAIRDAKQDREATTAADRAALARVQGADSDLHLMVSEGRLSLAEAVALLDRRAREAREQRQRKTHQFMQGATLLWGSLFGAPGHIVETWLPDGATWQHDPSVAHLWTADGLRRLAALLGDAAEAVDQRGGTLS